MSADKLDTDALATEEMLKMFENMESHDLDTLEALEDNLSDDLSDIALTPIAMTPAHDELELAELDLPDISQSDSIDADIIEMPDDDLSIMDIEPSLSETLELPESFDAVPEEIMPDALSFEPETESSLPVATETNNGIANHLNAVVENAVQALQDWLALRQQSEENGPQQGLAQLDVLLDTVTHQQQHLAEQLKQTPKVDYSGMANALGVTLPSPQSLGWSEDQWRIKANEVANKTNDISAMNAKLRKQLEQF